MFLFFFFSSYGNHFFASLSFKLQSLLAQTVTVYMKSTATLYRSDKMQNFHQMSNMWAEEKCMRSVRTPTLNFELLLPLLNDTAHNTSSASKDGLPLIESGHTGSLLVQVLKSLPPPEYSGGELTRVYKAFKN